MSRIAVAALCSLALALAGKMNAQPVTRAGIYEQVRGAKGNPTAIANQLRGAWMLYFADKVHSSLAREEVNRVDKQPGATPSSSGTTSLVERGTVPFLLGLAVENGAVTRSANGTSITFRTRPAGLARFLGTRDYGGSGLSGGISPYGGIINRISAHVTFDASGSGDTSNTFTGDRSQVSGFGFRADLWNTRDIRPFIALRDQQGVEAAKALTALVNPFAANDAYNGWITATSEALAKVADADLQRELDRELDRMLSIVGAMTPGFDQTRVNAAIQAWNNFAEARVKLVQATLQKPSLALEYSVDRQQSATSARSNAGTGVGASSATAGSLATPLPDLGTIRVVFAKGFSNNANLTINASATAFNNTFQSHRIRDYRAGVEYAAPLAEIAGWGKSALSFSALWLNLKNQPLGQQVLVNNIPVDARGQLAYVQSKFELPFGTSGIRIPIALTYASRHELLANEKNKLGANIGLTFDLDKLAAVKK